MKLFGFAFWNRGRHALPAEALPLPEFLQGIHFFSGAPLIFQKMGWQLIRCPIPFALLHALRGGSMRHAKRPSLVATLNWPPPHTGLSTGWDFGAFECVLCVGIRRNPFLWGACCGIKNAGLSARRMGFMRTLMARVIGRVIPRAASFFPKSPSRTFCPGFRGTCGRFPSFL